LKNPIDKISRADLIYSATSRKFSRQNIWIWQSGHLMMFFVLHVCARIIGVNKIRESPRLKVIT